MLSDTARQRLVDNYEDLRRDKLSNGGGPARGLALFVRDGMMAWMQAWIGLMAAEQCPNQGASTGVDTTAHERAEGQILPATMYPEITRTLTSMALSALEEQWS